MRTGRSTYRGKTMNRSSKGFAAKASGLACAVLLLSGCGDDEMVTLVKEGSLYSCPSATVGEMVDSYLGDPSWESGKDDDNASFVNVGGDMTYAGNPVRGLVQFAVDAKAGTFQYQAFEVNEIPQDNDTAAELLSQMCQSSRNS